MTPATILVVDDVTANRERLVGLLRDKGHRLLEAGDGQQGLEIVRAESPNLIITDVLMPVMDGYEFVRRLRLDPATARIPVLFYTSPYGEREARALALAEGVPFILRKPANPEEVLRIVGQVLGGEPPAPVAEEAARVLLYHLRLLTDEKLQRAGDSPTGNARLRALINITLDLGGRLGTEQLLEYVCEAAHDLFGASYVTLGIIDQKAQRLERMVSSGTDPTWISSGDPVPGMLATVVSECRPLRGCNASTKPEDLKLPAGHPGIQAYLAAPLASPTRVYGWICLVGNDGRDFTQLDEDLMMALSAQVGRVYEVEHEIAERKDAEARVGAERDRAQRYLDTAAIILLALDNEGCITQLNKYGCDMLGYTLPEVLGRDWAELCLPERLRGPIRKHFDRVCEGDLSIVDNAVVTRSGKERLIEWRNTLLRDEAGAVTGTLSSGTDITERVAALESLRIAEERMRFTLQNTGVGIWDMDYATGVLRWSETLETQYGLAPGTFAGTFDAFAERIHPDDRAEVLATIQHAMETGTDFTTEHRSLQPDGSFRWLSGAGRIHLDDRGKPVRGVGISLDVTQKKRLEGQVLQAQKMEAVGRLAAGVAHDFNNLLTAILGSSELVLDDLGADDPRRMDMLEIQKAGNRAAALTRQLLAFSRKEIIKPVLLDLNAIVTDIRSLLGRLLREDVQIALQLKATAATVKADRGELEQIVMNLAVNAQDAMLHGGTFTIGTANVELDEHYARSHLGVTPGPHVALTVSDTGTGIPPEIQRRLFEPFFTTKEAGKGTGLGLATVHGIVERTGGSITVYSEVGRGTTFTVYFPLAAGAVAPAPPATGHSRRRIDHPETVLVVEDAVELRQLTKRLLERQGYTALVAGNAAEALLLFDQHGEIDVLLTDVVMPGASGPELTKQLVAKRPGLKVIFMSGYTEDSIVQHGVLAGDAAFLHKPFTSEILGQKIREALDAPVSRERPVLVTTRDT